MSIMHNTDRWKMMPGLFIILSLDKYIGNFSHQLGIRILLENKNKSHVLPNTECRERIITGEVKMKVITLLYWF